MLYITLCEYKQTISAPTYIDHQLGGCLASAYLAGVDGFICRLQVLDEQRMDWLVVDHLVVGVFSVDGLTIAQPYDRVVLWIFDLALQASRLTLHVLHVLQRFLDDDVS